MNEDERPARAAPVLLGLSGIWGASFLFIKVAVEDTGALEVVAARLFFGALVVSAYVAFVRRKWIRLSPSLVGQVAVLALISNVAPFALITWGEEHIDSGRASVLNASTPIFAAAVAALLLDEERFTPARILGLVLGFLGVGVLTGTESLDVTNANVAGQLAVVCAALCYGTAAVFSRHMLRTHDPISLASLQFPLGVLIIVPAMLVASGGSPDYSLDPEAWASVITLGAAGTGLAYIMYLWLIENIGSVRASLVTYIVPVLALFLGWLILDETIGFNTIAGFLLIITGVATVLRGQAPARQRPVEPLPAAVGEQLVRYAAPCGRGEWHET